MKMVITFNFICEFTIHHCQQMGTKNKTDNRSNYQAVPIFGLLAF